MFFLRFKIWIENTDNKLTGLIRLRRTRARISALMRVPLAFGITKNLGNLSDITEQK